jgi:GH15 family glucan-1,4-alpha-glucosidase
MGRARRPPVPPARPGRLDLPAATALHDYGVIGNLRTAALVHRAGSVDWACLPKFASPSVFARILDARRGGTFLVRPVGAGPGVQRYRPSTNILETEFPVGDGTVTLVDFMPIAEGSTDEEAARIVRVVETSGGPADLEVWFEPRFDYGRAPAHLDVTPGGVVAASGDTSLALRAPAPFEVEGNRATALLSVPTDASVTFDLSWGAAPRRGSGVLKLLEETELYWKGWVHGPRAPLHRLAARWHDAVERSELVLKLLSHVDTGAFVAAPTTSLPEWPGGRRNWDYRYVWIRDAAFSAQAMLLLGHVAEARSFLAWVVDRLTPVRRGHRSDLHVMYGAHGESELAERSIPSLSGFLDSRPVRVGNAAYTQFQLDIYGELLDAANLLAALDPDGLPRPTLKALLDLADEVSERWTTPDQGIWEVRGAPRHFVHSKLMAWVAIDRAILLAGRSGGDRRLSRWRATAQTIRQSILTRGWDEECGAFVRSFGDTALDAANLRIPLVGFLPFDDPRVLATVRETERGLAEGPFVWRYLRPDGIAGEEGAFLPCSFWLVECLARSGHARRAQGMFEELLAVASPHGLFPEEWDPAAGRALGNYPQAFTHVGVLRAALALGLSTTRARRRDELERLARARPSGELRVPGTRPEGFLAPPASSRSTRATPRTRSRTRPRNPGKRTRRGT